MCYTFASISLFHNGDAEATPIGQFAWQLRLKMIQFGWNYLSFCVQLNAFSTMLHRVHATLRWTARAMRSMTNSKWNLISFFFLYHGNASPIYISSSSLDLCEFGWFVCIPTPTAQLRCFWPQFSITSSLLTTFLFDRLARQMCIWCPGIRLEIAIEPTNYLIDFRSLACYCNISQRQFLCSATQSRLFYTNLLNALQIRWRRHI